MFTAVVVLDLVVFPHFSTIFCPTPKQNHHLISIEYYDAAIFKSTTVTSGLLH